MEDFGLFKGTGIGFDDLWEGNEVISEVGVEKKLAEGGLRYRLNRTPEEAAEFEPLFGLPGFEVTFPLLERPTLDLLVCPVSGRQLVLLLPVTML